MKQTINVTDARNNFADIINRVQYRGETFTVKKQGKVVAQIIGVDPNQTLTLDNYKPPVFSMGGADSTYSREEIYE